MPGIEYKFDVHYKEKQDDTGFKRAPSMTEEQFLEWVKINATKVWYFDVFRFEKGGQHT